MVLEVQGETCGFVLCKCNSPIPAVAAALIPIVAVGARPDWALPPWRHRFFPSPNRWWVITWSWFIIQTVVVLLQSKHFCWLCPNAKTISQPPLILGFNCFSLLSTDGPLPHTPGPPPLSPASLWVFSCSHTANVMSNSCNIAGSSLKEEKKKKKKIPNTNLFAFRALPPFQ